MRCAVRGHLIKVPGTKIQHHYKGSAVKLGKQKIRVLKLSSGTLRKKAENLHKVWEKFAN